MKALDNNYYLLHIIIQPTCSLSVHVM